MSIRLSSLALLFFLLQAGLFESPAQTGESKPASDRSYKLLREDDNWGQSPFWNGYLNQRYMLYADLHYGPHVRTFIELKSGINSGRAGGPRPIDEKKLDFQAGFLEVGGTTSWG